MRVPTTTKTGPVRRRLRRPPNRPAQARNSQSKWTKSRGLDKALCATGSITTAEYVQGLLLVKQRLGDLLRFILQTQEENEADFESLHLNAYEAALACTAGGAYEAIPAGAEAAELSQGEPGAIYAAAGSAFANGCIAGTGVALLIATAATDPEVRHAADEVHEIIEALQAVGAL
jgi:hypothetical protein